MSEFLSNSNPEHDRERSLDALVEQYFPDDTDFLVDMDEEDKLGYVYGQLLELGEDPDEILHEFGVTEESND